MAYERHPIDELERRQACLGMHFFDSGAKRFFKSRIAQSCYKKLGTNRYLFLTSEKFEDGHIKEPRKWTVRSMDWETGKVTACEEFQQFSTRKEAEQHMFEILNGD